MKNKELSGAMFPHKKENEKQPDYKGSIKVGGKDFYIAGWNRKGKESNIPYMYIQLKPVEQKQEKPVPNYKQAIEQVAEAVNETEEVPF